MRIPLQTVMVVLLGLMLSTQVCAQQASEATERLLERNQMFEPRIIRVADNVFVSVGYQVSTNSMIVGDDGVIIVDPGIAPPLAEKMRAEFRKITDKRSRRSFIRTIMAITPMRPVFSMRRASKSGRAVTLDLNQASFDKMATLVAFGRPIRRASIFHSNNALASALGFRHGGGQR